ncbi:Crossover junction endonuclease mus81 [Dinochytrium kinnereticum]|nr:Crossover junction endonuclease mus81 [Dinochytrium kinnereticum]
MADHKVLFLQWLQEFEDEERKASLIRPSHMRNYSVYKKAYEELKKYPHPIRTPQEAIKVKHIGPGIIKRLERKLSEIPDIQSDANVQLQAPLPIDFPVADLCQPAPKSALSKTVKRKSPTKNKPKTTNTASRAERQYIPRYRSAAWAILVTLRTQSRGVGYLSKSDVIKFAQDHCDAPFTSTGAATSIYSGWSSMATLIDKDLVARYGNPPRFCLTEEGKCLADKIDQSVKIVRGRTNVADDISNTDARSESSFVLLEDLEGANDDNLQFWYLADDNSRVRHKSEAATRFIVVFPIGSFEILLLLDVREVKSGSVGVERTFFQDGLREKGIQFETRMLELGDFMWVARSKYSHEVEIVLDCILERKTLDDLVASIKDGRFKEQKFRLRECGLRHVIYLVEEGNSENADIFGMEAVYTTFTQTQVEDGFFLKRTASAEESLHYIISITKQLIGLFANQSISAKVVQGSSKPEWFSRSKTCLDKGLIIYSDFARFNTKTKNFTLKDVWTRQLMTISGISAEKACTIANKYPTSLRFMAALKQCASDAEREALIRDIGEVDRKVFGPTLCKRLLNLSSDVLLQPIQRAKPKYLIVTDIHMDFSQYFDIQKVTETFNKVKNAVLQLTEYQIKVLDATNNEPWGASSTLMLDIASATSHYQHFSEIMEVIYKRLQEPPSPTWRQTYKALQLLEYLIKNGSERVIDNAREHIYELKALRNFNYVDEKQKDQGINVKQRAKEIIDLLGDNDKIKDERRKAKENRAKYTGVSSSGFSNSSGGGGRYGGFGSDFQSGSSYRDDSDSESRYRSADSSRSPQRDRMSPVKSPVAEVKPQPVKVAAQPAATTSNQPNLLDFGEEWGDFSSAPQQTATTEPKNAPKSSEDFADFADFQSAPSVASVPYSAPAPATMNNLSTGFETLSITPHKPVSPVNPTFANFASFPISPVQSKNDNLLSSNFGSFNTPMMVAEQKPQPSASADPFSKLVSLDANSLSGLGKKAQPPGPSLNSLNASPFNTLNFTASSATQGRNPGAAGHRMSTGQGGAQILEPGFSNEQSLV